MPPLRLLAILLCLAPTLAMAAAQNKDAVAVIIGNKVYQHNDVPEVSFAHRDADAIKRYVIEILGFRERNVIDLRDATQAQIEGAFGNERSHKGALWRTYREDRSDIVVYYSGHGMPGLSDGKGYLLPSDVAPTDAEIGGYPLEVLYANLKKLKARSVLVLLDACFSGNSHGGSLVPAGSIAVVAKGAPLPPRGLTVLTAAGANQVASWDLEAQHGLFTEHLLRAVYGAADDKQVGGNGDGRVTVAEVKAHLDEEMTYIAKRTFGREQVATVAGSMGRVLSVFPAGLPPLRSGLIEPMEAVYVAVSNANVRTKPTATAPLTTKLRSGSEMTVTGKVKGVDWYRVARGGQPLGYIYGPLIMDAEQVREVERQQKEAEARAAEQARLAKVRETERIRLAVEKAQAEAIAKVRAEEVSKQKAKAEARVKAEREKAAHLALQVAPDLRQRHLAIAVTRFGIGFAKQPFKQVPGE